MREPLEFTAEERAEEHWFNRTYGPWRPFDVDAARAFFEGFVPGEVAGRRCGIELVER